MNTLSQLIVVGTSTGGVAALHTLFSLLDDKISSPFVIVQHLPEDSSTSSAEIYAGHFPKRSVVEVMDKMPLKNNCVYFAPANYHLLIEKDGTFSLTQDEKVNFSRPSIDVTFCSAARALGSYTCGVLLTGANDDGAQGLLEIHNRGGVTIVQDPAGAASAAMPQSALKLFKPDYVGTIEEIAQKLLTIEPGE